MLTNFKILPQTNHKSKTRWQFFYGPSMALKIACSNPNVFVAFPWVVASIGPGGFMMCVFII